MVSDLKLKGAERDVFAIIYGITQDGESLFYGSLKYMSDLTGYSRNSICNALNSLTERGLLIKEESEYNNVKHCKYRTTYFDTVQPTCTGVQPTCTNNISNTKKHINKTISKDIVQNLVKEPKTKKKNLYESCSDMIEEYTNNAILRTHLQSFLKICLENSREAGRPFYQNMWKSKLTKLSELSDNTDTQIKIVKQTLDNWWSNFYEYRGDRKKTGNTAHDIEKLYGGMNERADKEHMTYGEKY